VWAQEKFDGVWRTMRNTFSYVLAEYKAGIKRRGASFPQMKSIAGGEIVGESWCLAGATEVVAVRFVGYGHSLEVTRI
jgi:hypothetical protein